MEKPKGTTLMSCSTNVETEAQDLEAMAEFQIETSSLGTGVYNIVATHHVVQETPRGGSESTAQMCLLGNSSVLLIGLQR